MIFGCLHSGGLLFLVCMFLSFFAWLVGWLVGWTLVFLLYIKNNTDSFLDGQVEENEEAELFHKYSYPSL